MFKPGDIVRCISNSDRESYLELSSTYTVERINQITSSEYRVKVEGVAPDFFPHRFILVSSKPKRNLPSWF